MAVLITMGQVGYQNFQKKNRPTILLYAFVHMANGLELTGSFRHAALLFVHPLFGSLLGDTFSQQIYALALTRTLTTTEQQWYSHVRRGEGGSQKLLNHEELNTKQVILVQCQVTFSDNITNIATAPNPLKTFYRTASVVLPG